MIQAANDDQIKIIIVLASTSDVRYLAHPVIIVGGCSHGPWF